MPRRERGDGGTDFGRQEKATDVWLNGDLLDFYSLSSFEKDPRERRFSDELEMAKTFVDAMCEAFPKGEHLGKKWATMKTGSTVICPPVRLNFGRSVVQFERVLVDTGMNVNFVPDWRATKFGKLFVFHGHEIGRGGGGQNRRGGCICGRNRCPCVRSFPPHVGIHHKRHKRKIATSWSLGCLCDLSPDYMQHNQWNHGFGFVDVRKTGTFHFQNMRIVDGVVY